MLLGAAVPGSASVAVAEDPGRAANPPSLNERSSVIPLLTPVRIRLEADLGSQISTTGQHFPITLVAPIVVDGVERVAAGASGEGEVIHARRAGAAGAGGELVLAVRFVEVGGRRLRLRSLRLDQAGGDAIQKVDAFNAAAVLSPVPIGLLGFMVSGRKVLWPKGTVAPARTAEAFVLDPGPGPVAQNSAEPAGGRRSQGED